MTSTKDTTISKGTKSNKGFGFFAIFALFVFALVNAQTH
jgi:hypothetical protein